MTKKKPDEVLVMRLKREVFPVERTTSGEPAVRYHPDRYLHLLHAHRAMGWLILQLTRVALEERELRLSRFKDSGPGNPWRHTVEAATALEAIGMVELSRADALGDAA
jgi:hypothetical protein